MDAGFEPEKRGIPYTSGVIYIYLSHAASQPSELEAVNFDEIPA
jgi:hypothetical protein